MMAVQVGMGQNSPLPMTELRHCRRPKPASSGGEPAPPIAAACVVRSPDSASRGAANNPQIRVDPMRVGSVEI
ncbi:hypothetical protein GUJ93_ZPchr0006g43471 [Zizania palustris]|uniref:Uncharacterized protein n=1 Tax=Zizania palustris TaxID=103762 RepID=A0A8J5W3E7_ZIZPA|nr:hypothetical protein GUJ93_ZPchr0006g43471 [Zizania palustris]